MKAFLIPELSIVMTSGQYKPYRSPTEQKRAKAISLYAEISSLQSTSLLSTIC